MEKIATLTNLAQYKALSEKQSAVQLKLLTDNIAALIGSVIETTSFGSITPSRGSHFYEDVILDISGISVRKTGNNATYIDTASGECMFQYKTETDISYTELINEVTKDPITGQLTNAIFPTPGSTLLATLRANTTLVCTCHASVITAINVISYKDTYGANRYPTLDDINIIELTFTETNNLSGFTSVNKKQFSVIDGVVFQPIELRSGTEMVPLAGHLEMQVNGSFGGVAHDGNRVESSVDVSSFINDTANNTITLKYIPANRPDANIYCTYNFTLTEDAEDISSTGEFRIENIKEHELAIYNGDTVGKTLVDLEDITIEGKLVYSDHSYNDVPNTNYRNEAGELFQVSFVPNILNGAVRQSLRVPNIEKDHIVTAFIKGLACTFTYTSDPADLVDITGATYNGPLDINDGTGELTNIEEAKSFSYGEGTNNVVVNHKISFLNTSLNKIENYTVYGSYDNGKEYILKTPKLLGYEGIVTEENAPTLVEDIYALKKPIEAVIGALDVVYRPTDFTQEEIDAGKIIRIRAGAALGRENQFTSTYTGKVKVVIDNGQELTTDSTYTFENSQCTLPQAITPNSNPAYAPSEPDQDLALTTKLNGNMIETTVPLDEYQNKVITAVNYEAAKNFLLADFDNISESDLLSLGSSGYTGVFTKSSDPSITTDILDKKIIIDGTTKKATLCGTINETIVKNIDGENYTFTGKSPNYTDKVLKSNITSVNSFKATDTNKKNIYTFGIKKVIASQNYNSSTGSATINAGVYSGTSTAFTNNINIPGKILVRLGMRQTSQHQASGPGDQDHLVDSTGNNMLGVFRVYELTAADSTYISNGKLTSSFVKRIYEDAKDYFGESPYTASKKWGELPQLTGEAVNNANLSTWYRDSGNYNLDSIFDSGPGAEPDNPIYVRVGNYINNEKPIGQYTFYNNSGVYELGYVYIRGQGSTVNYTPTNINNSMEYVESLNSDPASSVNISLRYKENEILSVFNLENLNSTSTFNLNTKRLANFTNNNNAKLQSMEFNKITLDPLNRVATITMTEQ